MEKNYTSENIRVLEGLEAVRKRPGMYIGSTGPAGLHHLVKELVDNAIDESLAGHCDTIEIIIHKDNSVTVKDNGRGIPVDMHSQGKSALEVVFTVLHAGGKFDKNSYKVSGGLHGVGASVVNALSTQLTVSVFREGTSYTLEFVNQKPTKPLQKANADPSLKGTTITFSPDPTIFTTIEFDFQTLKTKLRELAFLNSGISITFTDERSDKSETFCYEGGLTEFVKFLSSTGKLIIDTPCAFSGESEDIILDVALTYTTNYSETLEGFVNNINTKEGGTHITGFRQGLTRAMNDYIQANRTEKDKKLKLTGDDIREGIVAIVSIKIPEPQFEGQTKEKLGNPEVQKVVQQLAYEHLTTFFEKHPKATNTIIDKAFDAFRAREAAKKARDLVRRKNVLDTASMPGKLCDCSTKDRKRAELFIVEGDSAGGTAKDGRNRETQAILPIKGKPLNVEKARLGKILENTEISAIITAIGTGIGDQFDIQKLRYDKIIIMTDADVDGSHIETLLLTFFYRYFKSLIIEGKIYLAYPPLYSVKKGKKLTYLYDEEERTNYQNNIGPINENDLQRYKGLGEMNPDQLWETTMDPEKRILKRAGVEDGANADYYFSLLMGDKVEPRKDFIIDNASKAEDLDI